MTNLRISLATGLGTILLAGTSVVAAQPNRPGPRCMPPHIQANLATYDANKNGRLDPEEHRAMRKAERAADLAQYDVDKDGKLSKTERDALHRDKMVEMFELLDRSGDADISKAEAENSCHPLEHRFDEVDTDGNGLVSWAEFEAAAPKGPPPHRGRRGHHPPPPPPEGHPGGDGPGDSCPNR